MIKLNNKQQAKKDLILKCLNGELSTLDAAIKAGVTRRTIQKSLANYKLYGDKVFVHGNIGKKKQTEYYKSLEKDITNIFLNTNIEGKNPFCNVTYQFFTECLLEYFNIKVSVNFAKKILHKLNHQSPIKHRCNKDEVHHLFRPRKESTGELVQADGTEYDWFMDGHKYVIQGFVDDATGYPVGLYMTINECLLGYTEAMRNMCTQEGIPMAIYPDKAGVFFVNQKTNDGEKHLTQFGVMMENLGVDMFPAHSPEAKGRIERFWKTIKHRLPELFVLRGIKTIEEANKFLRNEFPKIYQRWFPVKPKSEKSSFVKVDVSEITKILKATFPGKTDKSGVFLLKGYRFFCPELPDRRIRIYMNEQEGIWVSPLENDTRYEIQLVETDTSGNMPEVMKDLIDRVFLKNAKPLWREVYIDIDDVVLSQIKRKKIA